MHIATEKLRAYVGGEVRYVAPEPIGAAAFRYFAQATGDHNPLYLDPAAASRLGFPDIIAPPTLICETNQHTGQAPDTNGYIGHRWWFIPDGAVWIRGGNRYRFGRPVVAGDRISVVWRLLDAQNKITGDGRELVMLVSEAVYTDQHGEFLATNEETMFLADPPEV